MIKRIKHLKRLRGVLALGFILYNAASGQVTGEHPYLDTTFTEPKIQFYNHKVGYKGYWKKRGLVEYTLPINKASKSYSFVFELKVDRLGKVIAVEPQKGLSKGTPVHQMVYQQLWLWKFGPGTDTDRVRLRIKLPKNKV